MTVRVTPGTPISNTPILVSWHNNNVRDPILNLQELVPEPSNVGYPLVATSIGTGTSTGAFQKVTQTGIDSTGLDADTLDGYHAAEFSFDGHSHEAGGNAGEITMWNASSASVPSGKQHYTQMLNRFPVGANDLFTFGASGGFQTHDHVMSNHAHSMAHGHNTGGPSGTVGIDHPGGDPNDTPASGGHTHSTNSQDNTSTGDGIGGVKTVVGTHLPPYYAVTFMVQM